MFTSLSTFNDDISAWDTSKVTDMSYMFYNGRTFNRDLSLWNTSKVTNMEHMFHSAQAFNQNIGRWDTSQVTSMSNMFNSAQEFNKDLSEWDTSHVTAMNSMFADAPGFNQPIGKWNTSQVTTMQIMFSRARSFDQDLSEWDVSAVRDMFQMFYFAEAFNRPLNKWNTPQVVDMRNMFRGAKVFNQDISSWDTSQVLNMGSMFNQAHVFNQPLNSWNTKSVLKMEEMFSQATAFNQPLGDWNTAKVSVMRRMFYNATSFDQDLSSWNISSVTRMSGMFEGATSFDQMQVCNWGDDWRSNFESLCNNTATAPPTSFGDSATAPPTLDDNGEPDDNGNGVPCTSDCKCFESRDELKEAVDGYVASDCTSVARSSTGLPCSAKEAIAAIYGASMGSWCVSSVNDMSYLFASMTKFNEDISDWDVSSVVTMEGMFQNAAAFDQDLSLWNVSLVTTTNGMFEGAVSFQLDSLCSSSSANKWKELLDLQQCRPTSAAECSFCFKDDEVADLTDATPKVGSITRSCLDLKAEFEIRKESLSKDGAEEQCIEFQSEGYLTGCCNQFNPSDICGRCFDGSISGDNRNDPPFTRRCKSFESSIELKDVVTLFVTSDCTSVARSSSDGVSSCFDKEAIAAIYGASMGSWCVSSVNDMSYLFASMTKFNEDISDWDVSSVVTMEGMFQNAAAFDQDISLWNVSLVTNMDGMFEGAISFQLDSLCSSSSSKWKELLDCWQQCAPESGGAAIETFGILAFAGLFLFCALI
ncbi:unnamed protein product [Cylindrotheca closterium]|uniref:BspA family leucine-rich repeat surface protein n=1 Tax=Cylindrotheca closterium TaxID=2856 RepID=A0AAD2FN41_9STRA|nr:unnamed protein product [Cylindrotheca closterium]